jgi:hypothetical protein
MQLHRSWSKSPPSLHVSATYGQRQTRMMLYVNCYIVVYYYMVRQGCTLKHYYSIFLLGPVKFDMLNISVNVNIMSSYD